MTSPRFHTMLDSASQAVARQLAVADAARQAATAARAEAAQANTPPPASADVTDKGRGTQ